MIYLDYASHTPTCEEVLQEFLRVERSVIGNALSAHGFGVLAQKEVKNASENISSILNVCPEEIIFTSGSSESNNMAVKGLAKANWHKGKHILSTCLEHPSVQGALQYLGEMGFEIELLGLDKNGQLDVAALAKAVRSDTVLACLSAVDGELGSVLPMDDVCSVLGRYPNVQLHVDASQAIGKFDVKLCGASTLSFSPHKFYGPLGIGVLYKKNGVVLESLIHGKGASLYRGGTPTPALAAACSKALCLAYGSMPENFSHMKTIHGYASEKLRSNPKVQINSPKNCSPYILNFSINGIKARDSQKMLGEMGIAVSTKSACSSDNAPSRAVFAITGDRKRAASSLRLGFGIGTTYDEIDVLVECVGNITGKTT